MLYVVIAERVLEQFRYLLDEDLTYSFVSIRGRRRKYLILHVDRGIGLT